MNSDQLATVFEGLTISMIVGSLAVWLRLWYRGSQGLPLVPRRNRVDRPRVPVFALTLALTLLFLTFFGLLKGGEEETKISADDLSVILLDGVISIGLLLSSIYLGVKSRAEIIRLGFRTDDLKGQIRDGIGAFLACVFPTGLMLLITSPIRSEETEHAFLQLLKESSQGSVFAAIVVTAVVLAPLKEELMFRVILQTWLEEFCPPWLAIFVTSLAFAAIHGMPDSLALFPLALILGTLYQRRRSYLSVVVVHALFNAYNIFASIATRQ